MPETTIATYAAAWRETDPVERLALLMRCWAPAGTDTDPPAREPEGDVLEGMDHAAVGDDGPIRRTVGFFGPLSA